MKTESNLTKYEFFKRIENELYTDSLTHTVRGEYVKRFVMDLIVNKTPFGAIKVNADNFKLVNDSFGFRMGDTFLAKLGGIFNDFIGDRGVVGRVGGDEFLIIVLGEQNYDSMWAILKDLFDNNLRKNEFNVSSALNFRLTCTAGAAIYPANAETYEELFQALDKVVYRGKKKGRNCFICYVEEKHRSIDPSKKNVDALCDDLFELHEILSKKKEVFTKITNAIDYLCNNLTLQGGYFIQNSEIIVRGRTSYPLTGLYDEMVKPLIKTNGLFSCNNYAFLKDENNQLHDFCVANRIYSFVGCEIRYEGKSIGYLVFVDSILKRVWQEQERALVSFIAKSIAYLLNIE